MYVFIQPAHKQFEDSCAVLFRHHLMSVARKAHTLEPHERGLHACLIQPFGYAMSVGTAVACLSGHVQNRYRLEIYESMRWFFLYPARNQVRSIGLFLANRL